MSPKKSPKKTDVQRPTKESSIEPEPSSSTNKKNEENSPTVNGVDESHDDKTDGDIDDTITKDESRNEFGQRESVERENDTNFKDSDNSDNEIKGLTNRANRSRSKPIQTESGLSYIPECNSINTDDKLLHTEPQHSNETFNWHNAVYLLILLVAIAGLGYFTWKWFNNDNDNNNILNNNKEDSTNIPLNNIIHDVSKEFPSQNDKFWKTLSSGIQYVHKSNPTKPAIFLLIHNGYDEVVKCLAYMVGTATKTFFGTSGIIEIIGDHVTDKIDNQLIVDYEAPLNVKGVMIVHKLELIPGEVAKSFHSFCDTYNPLVKRAVLLFTLNINKFNTSVQNDRILPNSKASTVLESLWKHELLDSQLKPLITRLTDNVLEVNSENQVPCSNW